MPDLITVPLSRLCLSRFNARSQRPASQVTRLAERMQRNGFEVTRALWVYANGDGYEVFAGGTRFLAAQEAGLSEVPVMLYPADDLERISRLADEDNENDEYHVPVPLPDVWIEYKRLTDEEQWTQQQIADAKGVLRPRVAERLSYAGFSAKVLARFVQNDFLKESHAAALDDLYKFVHLTPWFTRDDAMTEIMATILGTPGKPGTHRGSSEGIAPTASVFAKAVATWNAMLAAAETALKEFPVEVEADPKPYHPREAFLTVLAADTVRTTKDVLLSADIIHQHLQYLEAQRLARIAEAQRQLTEEQAAAEVRAQELEWAREQHAYRDHILRCLAHGDCRTLLPYTCPADIRLVLTDPPYGKQFQSHRRVTTQRKAVVEGDGTLTAAGILVRAMLQAIRPKLAADAHLFLFTHQDSYHTFWQALTDEGFEIRRTMTWVKGTHGLGDTTRGEALTETEWLLHAVQGNPKFTENIDRSELLDFPGTQDTGHPMEKPGPLLRHLIALATEPGDLVVDPFAGTANTLVAALDIGRMGWACEIETEFYQAGAEKLYNWVEHPRENDHASVAGR